MQLPMSALGHKRPYAVQKGMSALPRKRHQMRHNRMSAKANSGAVHPPKRSRTNLYLAQDATALRLPESLRRNIKTLRH
jgi:hypothetical protein